MNLREKRTILAVDPDAANFPAFYAALRASGDVHIFPTIDRLLAEGGPVPVRDTIYLLDTLALQNSPTALVAQLLEQRGRVPMGLITQSPSDQYLMDLRRWGILQIAVKAEPLELHEIGLYVQCVADPLNGFGLYRYLGHTMEMYNLSIHTIKEKNDAVEKVINHFATANFEIHELFDVRLILEETLNNSFFHAFRKPSGEEKYSMQSFRELDPEEKIRIEYGNDATMSGFTVTDNAGSLPVRTIMHKLERQLNREGLFDSSGRGLYLSRMLSTAFIINIEEAKRTQMVALFDARRKLERPKPFMVNYVGPDTFGEWRLEEDFD
ncbi:hypothetical protein BH09SUM1_BH09SUM1_28180 [soil metagenome]